LTIGSMYENSLVGVAFITEIVMQQSQKDHKK